MEPGTVSQYLTYFTTWELLFCFPENNFHLSALICILQYNLLFARFKSLVFKGISNMGITFLCTSASVSCFINHVTYVMCWAHLGYCNTHPPRLPASKTPPVCVLPPMTAHAFQTTLLSNLTTLRPLTSLISCIITHTGYNWQIPFFLVKFRNFIKWTSRVTLACF